MVWERIALIVWERVASVIDQASPAVESTVSVKDKGMGRKKKPFIDKKKAQTFRLVPRSQQDPLFGEEEESQYVLKPTQVSQYVLKPTQEGNLLTEDERLEEQQKYGIQYTDDYDYLQHLKEPGTAIMEPMLQPQQGAAKPSLELPSELFGSEVKVEGRLSKVLPTAGPQPDWDPDIVAALDTAEMTSDPEDQLEDDFVIQANGGEPGVPVYVTEDYQDSYNDQGPWWMSKGDFNIPKARRDEEDDSTDQSDTGEESCDQSDEEGSMPEFERKTARFTEYSMSSSVVPRNDALTLLDERFEQFMVEYSETGAPEEEGEPPSSQTASDQWLLQYAVEDFDKNFVHLRPGEDGTKSGSKEGVPHKDGTKTHEQSLVEVEDEDSGSGNSSDGEIEVMEVEGGGRDQWDCESILSTYSNLYNHPTKITEPVDKGKQIKLSRKSGIPLESIPGPQPREKYTVKAPTVRSRGETKDEKRARKHAVKEERKHRRSEKKATKEAFKTEQLRQERQLASQEHTAAVV